MIYTLFGTLCCIWGASCILYIVSLFIKKLKPHRKKLLVLTVLLLVALIAYTTVFTDEIQAVQDAQAAHTAESATPETDVTEVVPKESETEIQSEETEYDSTESSEETASNLEETEPPVTELDTEAIEEELPQFSEDVMPEDLSDLVDTASFVEYDGVKYVDAEGYLNPGVQVYWIEDGKMEHAGEVKDIAYNTTINNTEYAYAVKVLFDGENEAYWKDGEKFLLTQKSLIGKPMYYVAVDDPNRRTDKEEIDYSGSLQWKPLSISNAEPFVDVYMGTGSSKSYLFTIISVNAKNNEMVVRYLSGKQESKAYSKMINNDALFVKE